MRRSIIQINILKMALRPEGVTPQGSNEWAAAQALEREGLVYRTSALSKVFHVSPSGRDDLQNRTFSVS